MNPLEALLRRHLAAQEAMLADHRREHGRNEQKARARRIRSRVDLLRGILEEWSRPSASVVLDPSAHAMSYVDEALRLFREAARLEEIAAEYTAHPAWRAVKYRSAAWCALQGDRPEDAERLGLLAGAEGEGVVREARRFIGESEPGTVAIVRRLDGSFL